MTGRWAQTHAAASKAASSPDEPKARSRASIARTKRAFTPVFAGLEGVHARLRGLRDGRERPSGRAMAKSGIAGLKWPTNCERGSIVSRSRPITRTGRRTWWHGRSMLAGGTLRLLWRVTRRGAAYEACRHWPRAP